MTFIGEIEFKDGRSPGTTTASILRRCIGGEKQAAQEQVDDFLERLAIKPIAFFRDIDTDWHARPFIGQHVFKIARSAGYLGTEDDLWLSVTGGLAPYAFKGRTSQPKRTSVNRLKTMVTARQKKAHAVTLRKK